MYAGDFTVGDTVDLKFTTRRFSSGAPFTLAGSPVISAYPDNSVTQITAGITLSVDFDGVTGLNNVRVVASGGNGYAAGSSYFLVITTGTVDSVSVVGEVIGSFTLGRDAAFTRLGAPAGASVSADVAGVQADTDNIQTRIPAALVSGRIDASVGAMAANVLTATAINADAITAAKVAADVTTEIQTGLATAAALATVQADTDDIQTRLPAALVSGRMDSSVGAMAANVMTAAAAAADLTTELQTGLATSAALATVQADTDDIQARLPAALVSGRMDANVSAMAAGVVTAAAVATNAIDADALAADAVTEIAAGVSVGSAPTAAQNAAAVWNEAIAGHLGAGSTGAKLNGLSGASGSGAITHVFTVTSGGNPVDGALVWVTTDAAGVNTVASATTDALGHATVFLDAGTYFGWAQRGGINFTEGSSFVVS